MIIISPTPRTQAQFNITTISNLLAMKGQREMEFFLTCSFGAFILFACPIERAIITFKAKYAVYGGACVSSFQVLIKMVVT